MSSKLKKFRINEEETHLKIDSKDEMILSMLSDNSRLGIGEIAAKIQLSKEGTFYRIKKLQERDIILGFYPIFDLREFGFNTFHVYLVIDEGKLERKKKLLDYLIKHPNTKGVMEYSDRWDLEWVIVAKDVVDFDNYLTDLTKEFHDVIIEKKRFEIILGYKSIQFPDPNYFGTTMFKAKNKHLTKLDDKGHKLVKELVKDSRNSTYKIGENIGLSADAVRYRLKQLYSAGVIRNFSTLTNLSGLGYHLQTICVSLKTFDLNHEMKFKEFISRKPEILRAVKILGEWDLMLTVVVKKLRELHSIVKEIQQTFSDIIINYQTWGAYKEHYFTSIPKIILDKE